MFKEKSTKKRIVTPNNAKESATLDARHSQILQKLSDRQGTVGALHDQRAELERRRDAYHADIDRLRQDPDALDSPEYEKAWADFLQVKEDIVRAGKGIADLESCKEEIEYYEKTAGILYEYYNLIENQGKVRQADAGAGGGAGAGHGAPPMRSSAAPALVGATTRTKRGINVTAGQTRNILEAFAGIGVNDAGGAAGGAAGGSAGGSAGGAAAGGSGAGTSHLAAYTGAAGPSAPPLATIPENDKSTLVDNYLSATDPTYIRRANLAEIPDICLCCHTPLVCLQQEGIMVCTECGYQELLLVEQNRPILRAPSAKEGSHFSYKRINHFKEWCAQIQAKESTDIPEEVFEKILAEIKKEKIIDTKRITYSKMREILKKLKMNKYFEHINYIINRINGVPTPHFSPELEEKLFTMFRQTQGPFLKHCPPNRKNYLSYSYVLAKLLQILGLHEYLGHFQLLKSREKIFAHDVLWRKITADLGWPFYSTI
jgi:hypothetical protein